MEWSPQQDNALLDVRTWLGDPRSQVFHLFGYAGTGKTTLAKHLAQNLDGEVLFAAYTGKAAQVLRSKGCDNATTIHSLIYRPRSKSAEELILLERKLQLLTQDLIAAGVAEEEFLENKEYKLLLRRVEEERRLSEKPIFILNEDSSVRDASLVIIDECSMVDSQMGKDLLSFGVKLLVLGDPAQLPPIGSGGYFTENVTPDVMLEEIHRQAADSPIIRLATEIRNQRNVSLGSYGDNCEVILRRNFERSRFLDYDQILVGKNKTRFSLNNTVRGLRGIEDPYPVPQDKLVCLKNNQNIGILNGCLFRVVQTKAVQDEKVYMELLSEDENIQFYLAAHECLFTDPGSSPPWFQRSEAEEFDYGYALTVHKSQGSQWNSVVLVDESEVFRKDKWRWLYTGITRAAERLTIIRG